MNTQTEKGKEELKRVHGRNFESSTNFLRDFHSGWCVSSDNLSEFIEKGKQS